MFLVFYVRPNIMRGRGPITCLKPLVIAYNAIQVFLNVTLLVWALKDFEMLRFTWRNVCLSPLDEIEYFDTLATLGWCYYMLKIIDLLDTMFFVLMKKQRHVSVLHVYHHVTMVFMTWVSLKYIPAYQNLYLATMNSAIHVVLYAYYFITSIGYRADVKFKRSVTVSQMTQFVCMIMINSYMITCQNHPSLLAFTLASTCNIAIFLALFINFYVHSYDIKGLRDGGAVNTRSTPSGQRGHDVGSIAAKQR
ncbi:28.8 kDa Fatty acid elongase [Spodoptera frugiperda ascovirus 1a]|uniref:28.8 kDa Fatty acid elongase n=1 Tax=Spodoptera frugiperda ascovirus 1a TaxID=113370 RepID=Q0E514_SFAVA|nr:28.8 kDa Fatty acid elongase [Spodoptera frugiperda ascovirus 1a]CAL44687.1 28.8 kDa Fatty acid elongase [Spodoptera frugiperda ascovirus 1a]